MAAGNLLWDLDRERFQFSKTFLDPVHGDISVTRLEVQIIDTPDFQRLHGVKQLGTADMVFHGAKHDRFAHSLGTMAVAAEMAGLINSGAAVRGTGQGIFDEALHLTRIAALLHDIGHAPYGHQLEDDFPILEKHDSAARIEQKLGASSRIGSILGPRLSEAVIAVLSAKDERAISALTYPFVADIVGNTVCADLLDYSARDVRYTGLEKASGKRMLKYLLIPEEGPAKGRIVVDVWKDDHLRSDVISDILDLLDVRFALAERVLFHHTKMATGAMLARAVADSSLRTQDIIEMRDDELMLALTREQSETSARLASALWNREIYKAVWLSDQARVDEDVPTTLIELFGSNPDLEGIDARRSAFAAKTKFEDRLCEALDLPAASILISCPSKSMLLKEAQARVNIDGRVKTLEEVQQDPPKGAIEELKRRHRALWKFQVFVDPKLLEEHGAVIADAIDLELHRLGVSIPNHLRAWQPREGAAIVDKFIRQKNLAGANILAEEREQLLTLAARAETEGGSMFGRLESRLSDIRSPEQPTLPLDT